MTPSTCFVFYSPQVFDKFIPCLKDSNSKVNLLALQVLHSLTPVLCDYFATVTNLTIQTVASNLSSKNKEIYDSAAACLDAFMEHLGKMKAEFIFPFQVAIPSLK